MLNCNKRNHISPLCVWYGVSGVSVWQKDDGVYRQISNISGILFGHKIVDHSDVVAASPVGTAPTTSSFST